MNYELCNKRTFIAFLLLAFSDIAILSRSWLRNSGNLRIKDSRLKNSRKLDLKLSEPLVNFDLTLSDLFRNFLEFLGKLD